MSSTSPRPLSEFSPAQQPHTRENMPEADRDGARPLQFSFFWSKATLVISPNPLQIYATRGARSDFFICSYAVADSTLPRIPEVYWGDEN